MSHSELLNQGLTEIVAALSRHDVSAVELATAYLDRIDQAQPDLNAFITLDREHSLRQAAIADKMESRLYKRMFFVQKAGGRLPAHGC
jgi:Asp-tRNA(Asn)/Glu-tRNA(Gln) amidotransferase A subunit family amidase